jgi:GNAT superfamily N-acetyltransferase
MSMSRPLITVRSASGKDFDDWLRLWSGYLSFYRAWMPPAVTRLTWTRLLSDEEPMHAALAYINGEAAGLVHWIFHRSTWTEGDYCYLQDLFVGPGRRGAGVGRRLVEHVYDQAASAGASRVHWLTHESNSIAMKLYDEVAERSGFVQYRKLLPIS